MIDQRPSPKKTATGPSRSPEARAPAIPLPFAPELYEQRLLALYATTETRDFIEATFALLEATVSCDWTLTFLHIVEVGEMRYGFDSRGREYDADFLGRHLSLMPKGVEAVRRQPGIKLLPTRGNLEAVTEEGIRATPYYREMMRPMGFRHSVALFFWDSPKGSEMQALFSVLRAEGREDFDAVDLQRLERVHDHIDVALRRLNKNLADRAALESLAKPLRQASAGAAILNWALETLESNPAARRLCARWRGEPETRTRRKDLRLPVKIENACQEFRREYTELSRTNPRPRLSRRVTVTHPALPGLFAVVTMTLNHPSELSRPGFHLHLEHRSDSPGGSDPNENPHPALALLTPAQREVALLATQGLGNKAIAARLGRSVSAVKFALHGAYKRLHLQNRVELARLLRTPPTASDH